jgi:hypothetical protein
MSSFYILILLLTLTTIPISSSNTKNHHKNKNNNHNLKTKSPTISRSKAVLVANLNDQGSIIPLPHLSLPPYMEPWCSHPNLLKPNDPTYMNIDHISKFPSGSIIFIMGDSTVRVPFSYIAACVLKRPVEIMETGGSNNNFPRVLSVTDDRIQIIQFSSWEFNFPYSSPLNRVNPNVIQILTKYGKPGFFPYAIWTNFALLHTLHRFPIEDDRHGDYEGFMNLQNWIVQDLNDLIHLAGFNRIVISAPDAICLVRLDSTERKWSTIYDTKGTSLQACKDFYGVNVNTEYCFDGAATPENVNVLADRLHNIISQIVVDSNNNVQVNKPNNHGDGNNSNGNNNNSLNKHIIRSSKKKNDNSVVVSDVLIGWLDSNSLTLDKCALTVDGQHYNTIYPYEVEAFLRFVV